MNNQNLCRDAVTLTACLPFHEIRAPKDYIYYKVRVKGGLGGNAEQHITEQRANAIKIVANLLQVSIQHQHVPLYIVRFEGGDVADSIAGHAEAVVAIPADMEQDFKDIIIQGSCAVQAQYGVTDPDVEVLLDPAVWHGNVIDELSTRCILADINALPVGPLEMDDSKPGKALISLTIGQLLFDQRASQFQLFTVCRSRRQDDLSLLITKVQQILEVSGADVNISPCNS